MIENAQERLQEKEVGFKTDSLSVAQFLDRAMRGQKDGRSAAFAEEGRPSVLAWRKLVDVSVLL